MEQERLVIFGTSNILSDLLDCALALRLPVSKIVLHLPEDVGERDLPLQQRLEAYARMAQSPKVESLDDFQPEAGEIYLIGPTSPGRRGLVNLLVDRFNLTFTSLIHPEAYVSSLAEVGEGVFIGANSSIAAGAVLAEHVFINRGVTIGHDTHIGAYSRVQPGSNVGGLTVLGEGVTVGLGATILERLQIGGSTVIGGGAVVLKDLPSNVLAVGIPAIVKKVLPTT